MRQSRSSGRALRWAMVAGTALLVRDLVVWVLLTRAAPHERWTGALWLVWLAASWTVLGGIVHAAGVPAALAMFAGPPWEAMVDGALGLNDLPRAAGAASAGAVLAFVVLAFPTRMGNNRGQHPAEEQERRAKTHGDEQDASSPR